VDNFSKVIHRFQSYHQENNIFIPELLTDLAPIFPFPERIFGFILLIHKPYYYNY